MISKSIVKLVRSLDTKKNRRKEGLFVAEGPKVVGDLMRLRRPSLIIATEEWFSASCQAGTKAGGDEVGSRVILVTEEELRKISFLTTPQQVLALFPIPTACMPDAGCIAGRLSLVLDGVQDPGNLGTIIRIADWFGISDIFCSMDTADLYNPKVVQATMGSIARVNVVYTDLAELLDSLDDSVPVYGTLLDGSDIYAQQLSRNGLIVMGNEGNGISPDIRRRINRRLLIPAFSSGDTAESLNVAIATAITCSEFRRRR